jgi:predicted dehydrogenase
MGEVEELYGVCRNLNHPYIEVEDTALAIIKFRNGGLGSIIASNSQKPGIYGKVHVHGSTGYSVGVQTDGGAMFVAGLSSVQEPAINDIWTIPGEQEKIAEWRAQDRDLFLGTDPVIHFIRLQIEDFAQAVINRRTPLIDGVEGRKTVEIFTALYRSNRDNRPVSWPLSPEATDDFDGRRKVI